MNDDEIASGSGDKSIKIWKKKENQFELVQTMTGHQSFVWTLIKLNDDEIASGSDDKSIKIWKKKDNQFEFWKKKGIQFELV